MVGYLYLFILNSAFPTEDTTSERGGDVYQLLPWDAKNTFPSGETRDTKQKENSEDEIVRKLLACYSFKWVYVEWIKLVVFGFLRVEVPSYILFGTWLCRVLIYRKIIY